MGTVVFRVLGSWVKGGTTHNNGDSEGKEHGQLNGNCDMYLEA